MPRLIFLLAFSVIAIAPLTCLAQPTCTLKVADLPAAAELIGFRVGMTKDQVKGRAPQVSFGGTDDLGVSKVTINPDFDSKFDKASFPGVRSVSMDFLDTKLTSLWFGYDSTFKWKTVEDFVKGISQSLHLPDAWQSWRVRGRQLKCADFSMTVSIIAEGPSFRIVDEAAANDLAARREAKEAAATEASSEDEDSAELPEIVADKKIKTYFNSTCLPEDPIPEKDRVFFKTATDAEAAGYKKSKGCS
jgi:hypothetical protein